MKTTTSVIIYFPPVEAKVRHVLALSWTFIHGNDQKSLWLLQESEYHRDRETGEFTKIEKMTVGHDVWEAKKWLKERCVCEKNDERD